MWAGRIAAAIVLLWSAFCLTLAAVVFVKIRDIESPDRYPALLLGLAMLYMGGSLLVGLIWRPKPKDPNAPIEIPPLDLVRGRTSYRDDGAMTRNVLLLIGAIFLTVSLGSAAEQPILLVIAVVSAGILAGAGVVIWRQIQYGRARLRLDAPARRGDPMRGVITTSGSGWAAAGHRLGATVELLAIQTFRGGRQSRSVTVARAPADTTIARDGKEITFRFTTTVPVIDTSEGRFSWNIQLETLTPKYQATFLIDVG